MKTLLMNMPSSISVYGKSKIKAAVAPRPFLSMAELGAAILETGNKVEILDFQLSSNPIQDLVNKINNYKPDMIGLTFTTPLVAEAIKLTKFLREKFPEIKQIAGGVHPTIMPKSVLENSEIDIVVIGEADRTVQEIVQGKKLSQIKGIAYKEKGKIKFTKPRPLIENLDSLPLPAWHLFPVSQYKNPRMMARKNPVGTIGTSRGCVFGCIYCNKSVFGRKFRAKSVARVVKEFEHLKKSGFNEVHVWDDMFSTDLKRAKEICRVMIKKNLNLTWQLECGVRVNSVDLEFFQLARKAGCYKVAFGYESGNQKILDNMNKGINLQDSENATNLARQAGLEVSGFFMFGLPGETIETMEDTIKFACKLNPDMAKVTILVPFPSTPVFDDFKKQGLIISEDWTKYNFHTASKVYNHPNLSWEVLEKYYDLFYKRFYFRPNYLIKRFIRSSIRGELLYDIYYAIKTFF